jgi:serine protease Do
MNSTMNRIIRNPISWLCLVAVAGGVGISQIPGTNPNLLKGNPPLIARQTQFAPQVNASNNAASLQAMDAQFADLVEQISPSVVHIRVGDAPKDSDVNGMMQSPTMQGQGSGVIFRNDGWIVTNDHVVMDAEKVTVVLSNGKEYTGTVKRLEDDRNDIAVVKIDAKDLVAAPFAKSKVRPGQYAIAVGAPFGLENTVTIGHISALGRMNMAGGGNGETRSYVNMIQTDAAINPGNSGGPLLNIDGEVIGINTSIYSASAGVMGGSPSNAGIGFTIPAEQAEFIANLLILRGKVERGYLGVFMEPIKPYELEELNIAGGVRVGDVSPTGSAKKAGVQKGDIILKVGSYNVTSDQDLLNAMLSYAPGSKVDITVLRNGKTINLSSTVDKKPQEQQSRQLMPRGNRNLPFEFDVPEGTPFQDLEKMFKDRAGKEVKPRSESRAPGQKAQLGVQIADVTEDVRKSRGLASDMKGAYVDSVTAGSIAEELGLEAGDIITDLDGRAIESGADLVEAVKKFKTGEGASITYMRIEGNSTMKFTKTFTF